MSAAASQPYPDPPPVLAPALSPMPAVKTGLVFVIILSIFSIWILLLPIFPSQDGPMHRYYVHVLDSLLTHQHTYDAYQIRHPFPPYATHYFALLALSHLFSFDFAEKIFVVLMIITFAYGFRYCATGLGPSGGIVSLFVSPLLLGWTVMMGFMNYSLGLALMLWAAGLWQRASTGRPKLWLPFVLVVCVLMITHPVPLLILMALCLLDLALCFRSPARSANSYVQANWRSIAALLFLCAAFLYPAASIDPNQSSTTLHDIGLHKQFVTTSLLLTGVSPYNTRSTSFLINLYRLSLYVLLLVSLVVAARSFWRQWRTRQLTFGASLFVFTVLLCLSLPVLPDTVNGSFYFATRLVVLLWLGSMLSAGTFTIRPETSRKILIPAAMLFALITLATAEAYIRPVSKSLRVLEQQDAPIRKNGILLVGAQLNNWSRFSTQLAPDFYEWGALLPFIRQNDVVYDSPWIEQNILPLQAARKSPMYGGGVRLDDFLHIQAETALQRLPAPGKQRPIVRAADFVLYVGTRQELSRGLRDALNVEEAAGFVCADHKLYLLCLRQ